MIRILFVSLFSLFAALSFVSCDFEGSDKFDLEDGASTAQYAAQSQQYFDELSQMSDEAITGDVSSFKTSSLCATVTLDTAASPRRIIVDFGPVNCLCNDGRFRRGKVIATFTGRYMQTGTTITYTTDQYFVNDNQVDGTRIVSNQGPNSQGQPVFQVDVNGTITLTAQNKTLSHSASRTRVWVDGYATPKDLSDDVYEISGSHSTDSGTHSHDAQILTPLRVEAGCAHITAGVVSITRSGLRTYTTTVDYGNGTCDNQATITLPDGSSRQITLP